MEAIKLTWYQTFFNGRFGYRKDYQASFWYYINQYIKRYIIDIYYYHDGNKEPYSKRVEIRGPRGGHTGNYRTEIIPPTKDTSKSLKITFFSWTWLSFYIKFDISSFVFRQYSFEFGINKLNWSFEMTLKNI